MLRIWLWTVGSVVLASAIPLAGLWLARLHPPAVERMLPALVSFAVGALLGGAMLHLLPEALAGRDDPRTVFGWFLLGFVGFLVLEMLLTRRRVGDQGGRPRLPPLAALNLTGDALHNAVDGMVVAAAYLTDPALGMTTTVAVILHEIPQELGDMGILLYSGMSVRRAVALNLLSAGAALGGAFVTLIVGSRFHGVIAALLPVAAGGFVYLAASELIPELRRRPGRSEALLQLMLLLTGLGLMAWTAAR